jgi:thiamine-phosphate pyrophosphorylase
MSLNLTKPILYLITAGLTSEDSTPDGKEFQDILELISAAVEARISLVQLREKRLRALRLFELAKRASQITRGSVTRLLVNDRADIAVAAEADGVHLTTRSLEPGIIRNRFGDNFIIGSSTHSISEALAARQGGADFVVLGPVFATSSKAQYGMPIGIDVLRQAAKQLTPYPVLALGGISMRNFGECLRAGAGGIAGIGLFNNASTLKETVESILSEV